MKFSGYLETTFRRGGVEVRYVAFSLLYLCFFPPCFGYIFLYWNCSYVHVFLFCYFFTHPPLVGTLSRVIKRQTAGPSTCRLQGAGFWRCHSRLRPVCDRVRSSGHGFCCLRRAGRVSVFLHGFFMRYDAFIQVYCKDLLCYNSIRKRWVMFVQNWGTNQLFQLFAHCHSQS